MEGDGFTLDDKRNKSDKNDIPDNIEKWKNKDSQPVLVSSSKKFISVDVKEIKANKYDLSISRYKKVEYEEVVYEKPDVIMEKVLSLEKEIAGDINSIKKVLSKQ